MKKTFFLNLMLAMLIIFFLQSVFPFFITFYDDSDSIDNPYTANSTGLIENLFFTKAFAQSIEPKQKGKKNIISTFAGNGQRVFRGDGRLASNAIISPVEMALDNKGNLFIADTEFINFDEFSNRIRKVDKSTGIITTIAGNGLRNYRGDGSQATSTGITPYGVAVDNKGNIFIADSYNQAIRKIDEKGIITTIAGNGIEGFSGDGGLAINAELNYPLSLCVDKQGNVLFVDNSNNRVRKVDKVTGIITTIAGNGESDFSGDGGLATAAGFSDPDAITLDKEGNILVTDSSRVRKIDSKGIVTTIAGNGKFAFSGDGGSAVNTAIDPSDVIADKEGNIFISDFFNKRVYKVDTMGILTTIVGGHFSAGDTQLAIDVLIAPDALEIDELGHLLIAEETGQIRKVDLTTGKISSIVGFKAEDDDELAVDARLPFPGALEIDNQGNIFICESSRIRKVDAVTGIISTFAGSKQTYSNDEGKLAINAVILPKRMVIDSRNNVFITESNQFNRRIRKIDGVTGIITTIAGGGLEGFSGDGGPAIKARLSSPSAITTDKQDNILFVDLLNRRIRRIDAITGIITTVVGNGEQGFNGDGQLATRASISSPQSIAVDSQGNLFISDSFSFRIRKVDAKTGIIKTVAGNGKNGFSGDGGLAINASLGTTAGITFDKKDNLFIADPASSRVRKVDAVTGIITTIAGNGLRGFSGDGGLATSARLNPNMLKTDVWDNLFILTNFSVRKVDASTSIISTVVGNGTPYFVGDGKLAVDAVLDPTSIAVDSQNNLLIADFLNGQIRKVDRSSSIISSILGNGLNGFVSERGFYNSQAVAVAIDDKSNIFIADLNSYAVFKIEATTGNLSKVAGSGEQRFDLDTGDNTFATKVAVSPTSIALDKEGNLFIVESFKNRIRRVDAVTKIITTIAGTGEAGFSGDGGLATEAELNKPGSIEIYNGNLFIADSANHCIRRVNLVSNHITTVAGTGEAGFSGDNKPASMAKLNNPSSVAIDKNGNLFIADSKNNRIRKVNTNGIISTFAGTGILGFSGDGDFATKATLAFPSALAVDKENNLFVVDSQNNCVRVITRK